MSSITTLQALPPYAKAVLCVMVSVMAVHVLQPVNILPTNHVIPGCMRSMLDSALSASQKYNFHAQLLMEALATCNQ